MFATICFTLTLIEISAYIEYGGQNQKLLKSRKDAQMNSSQLFLHHHGNTPKKELDANDWLALSLIKGVGPARLDRLNQYLQLINNPIKNENETIRPINEGVQISESLLIELKWPPHTAKEAGDYLIKGIVSDEVKTKLELTLKWLQKENNHLITKGDERYPECLKQIPIAPTLLYLTGDPNVLLQPKIGVVGSRKCTAYGRENAFNFAKELSAEGLTVVSGGAIGIDTSAHIGALSINSATIAVMGAGLMNLYPKINLSLYETILSRGGALISEYPVFTPVKAHLFPPRNRIISGISVGVFVIEATKKSGSLISAHYALQHNREVFALPGRISDKQAQGTLQLIQQGAKLVVSTPDILLELPQNIEKVQKKPTKDYCTKSLSIDQFKNVSREMVPVPWVSVELEQLSRTIIAHFDDVLHKEEMIKVFDFDELIAQLSCDAAELSQALMELELNGLIKPYSVGYVRCYK